VLESGDVFDLPQSKGSIQALESLPTSREFFSKFAKGWGTPLLLKGAAKKMAASQWSDDYLMDRFRDVQLDTVEHAKKESRVAESSEMNLGKFGATLFGGYANDHTLFHTGDFLKKYNHSDVYTVSSLPQKMKKQVRKEEQVTTERVGWAVGMICTV
jgi:lysine-specific demethylase 8